MPIETDALSLLFAGCFLFGLLFFVVTALMGSLSHGQGHSGHIGHGGDVGHGSGHVDAGHSGHADNAHHIGPHIHIGGHHAHGAKGGPVTHNGMMAVYGYLNPTSIVLFLMGFGFFGYVFHNSTPLALPLTLVFALGGGGLVAALLLAFIARVFGDSEGSTVQDVTERVGLLGTVSTTIRENEIGEMLYISPGGMRKSIPARSVDGRSFERGQEVVVVNMQRGVAEVDTWDHFLNDGEHGEQALSSNGVSYLTAPSPTRASEMEELRKLLDRQEPGENSHSTIQKDI